MQIPAGKLGVLNSNIEKMMTQKCHSILTKPKAHTFAVEFCPCFLSSSLGGRFSFLIVIFSLTFSFHSIASHSENSDCYNISNGSSVSSIDNRAVEKALAAHNLFLRTRENSSNPQLQKFIGTALDHLLLEGAELHLKNGEAGFLNALSEIEDSAGARKVAVYTLKHSKRFYFVKEYPAHIAPELLVDYTLKAQLLATLGVSPQSHLVLANGRYFLVMGYLSGINVKDVINARSRSRSTRESLEKALGHRINNSRQGVREFAQHFLGKTSPYLQRLVEIEEILLTIGFYSINDFQFMVDFTQGPHSLMVIDSEEFSRSSTRNNEPAQKVSDTIRRLIATIQFWANI